MQKDVGAPTLAAANPANHANTSADPAESQPSRAPWLKTPEIVKRVFDRFPLQTYEACELPQGRTSSRDKHALFAFTTEADAKAGRPSYNPGCLKWQVSIVPTFWKIRDHLANAFIPGILAFSRPRFCHCPFEQPCLPKWRPPVPATRRICFIRESTHSFKPASALAEK